MLRLESPILPFTWALGSLLAAGCAGDDVARPPDPAALEPSAAVLGASTSVFMSGLNSPRGLDWGPNGALYVVESGTTEVNGACVPFMEGPSLTTKCWSGTGSVSRLWRGRQERIAVGLPSTLVTSSNFASGPQDIGSMC